MDKSCVSLTRTLKDFGKVCVLYGDKNRKYRKQIGKIVLHASELNKPEFQQLKRYFWSET